MGIYSIKLKTVELDVRACWWHLTVDPTVRADPQ